MMELIEYSFVRVVQMFRPSNEYDDWGVNQRDPQIGDTGTLIDRLHAPNLPDKYVVENSGDDGCPIWLSDFFADEIQTVELPNMWPTATEIKELSKLLELPVKGNEEEWELQEWEWDFADPRRVEEFLTVYEQQTLSEHQKTALMALIVESYDRYLVEYQHVPSLWERIEKQLITFPKVHEYTINDWLLSEDTDEPGFSIGRQIKKVFKVRGE